MEKRLDQLSESITKAFHEDFVFLITQDKVQHFPARQWSLKDYQDMLHEKLGENYQLFFWHSILTAKKNDLFVLMPRFEDKRISEEELKKLQ